MSRAPRSNGELHTVANPDCLALHHSRDGQELQGTAPSRTDYEKRVLAVPSRLDREWLQSTPENVETSSGSDKVLMDIDKQLLMLDDFLALWPMVSAKSTMEKQDWALYLADDFHWRGGVFIAMDQKGMATVIFSCKEKRVAASRCEHVDDRAYERRIDTMAQTSDYESRGLSLPCGYYLERKLTRWFRQKAKMLVMWGFTSWTRNMLILRRCRGKQVTIAKQRSLKSLIQEACGQAGADTLKRVQPLQSEMVKTMPRYQRIPDAKTANLLA